ncbi:MULTISPECIES: LacI family DNA-binding transcriptional regulator [Aerococcus]|uniref:LacI family transcriptional regulator n=1 Tax=Aerococcus sanguinicola TaxID=119206 RepID=A0A5N1GLR3_9LACT|nr:MULTISPECIES: LacI family DNA-binding transcriptional regulator [Aerococcus]KAA9301256.1 LacI family transcriptional regulator [Aerococcus sanguinicola]MDK6369207.1 LacI family DNA-binding transcriptional regulator [Aerococcus sp. UMB9870]MDK6679031.1 LacI family DNA-binding transcriptional regulator [Aerococcus sp. UMB8608]MDK6687420.1 LacI family DNA-binding transcriptional regulator [Aerococcus sp. UMB8623]MDK6940093.1 LacI family DNA-binding transcriptional regulator [Aerococcus sp. UMB
MAVKLTDVAKRAGVSATTVSRVINNYGYLSQKTIDKVHQAMADLNYQPNQLARSLQGKGTQVIGVIMPSVAHPFYGELVDQIEGRLSEQNYRMILCDSADDPAKEKAYLRMLVANQVDGIIAGAHNLGIEEYQTIQAPVVSFDRFLSDRIPIVGSDNYQGGELASRLLVDKGCQKIACLTGSLASDSPTNDRLAAYEDVMVEAGLDQHVYSFLPNQSPLVKRSEIKRLLSTENWEGVFCTDDLTALLVYQEAQALGLTLPKDLKLVGYDGSQFMQGYFPYLTTVVQPLAACAEQLVHLVLDQIGQGKRAQAPAPNYKYPVSLWTGSTV